MAFLGFASKEEGELAFADLFTSKGLGLLQAWFERELLAIDGALHAEYRQYLGFERAYSHPAESDLLLRLAPHVEAFIGERFGVLAELAKLRTATRAEDRRFRFKREIVTRRIRMKRRPADVQGVDPASLLAPLDGVLALVAKQRGMDAGREPSANEALVAELALDVWDVALPLSQQRPQKENDAPLPVELQARIDALRALIAPAGPVLARLHVDVTAEAHAWVPALQEAIERSVALRLWHPLASPPARAWVSQVAPKDVDFSHLVHIERLDPALPEAVSLDSKHWRQRPGFRLTDKRGSTLEILDQIHYCIYCHPREKDSCSRGFRQKDGSYKKNPLGVALEGCPLEERISEMHTLRKEGYTLSALAMIMVDNPMCPGTGHRICNDCMKGCIYQKQSPVNIPAIETHVLSEVLALPYGVEIYGLLARWNPLNRKRMIPRENNGKTVLVVGLGPAGYTLAYHLSQEGFGVVAVDGAKLEPLPTAWLGTAARSDRDDVSQSGSRLSAPAADAARGPDVPPEPIRDYAQIAKELDERAILGFGGVSEYGITVRWDKNFLTLMYLTLSRQKNLRMIGGVRFGGTVTLDDAWALGFDHVALAAGAGKPTLVGVKNNVARGIRQASDFLMALQLTGAFKAKALANLQVRLPAIVIGGGLTAIDTATELLAYYVVQVERMLARHDVIAEELGEAKIFAQYAEEELGIYKEFLEHGRQIRAERQAAAREGREPHIVALVNRFGGVKIVYRKSLADSPAYRLNHEEIEKCLEEGVEIVECLSPIEAQLDRFGAVGAMVFERIAHQGDSFVPTGEQVTLPAHTVCVAAGTSPNTTYEKEYSGSFALDDKKSYFRNFAARQGDDGRVVLEETLDGLGFFTSYLHNGRTVSYYGDNHPRYAGSVVKAMASAKDGYSRVVDLFAREVAAQRPADQARRDAGWQHFASRITDELSATVVRVDRLTDTIVDVVVRAPLQARKFKPGQFYRLQNYETHARDLDGTPLVMEGVALTGAWTDAERGMLSMIVLQMGPSSRLCAELRPGERVVVMGPTGAPTHIPHGQNVVLVGGGLGNAVLFSIAKALKDNGCRVLYFAGYKSGADLFKQEEIERSTDQIIWSTDGGGAIAPRRPDDQHFRGNIVQAMLAYAEDRLGTQVFPLEAAKRFIVIGSDRMMAAVARVRHAALKKHCAPDHVAMGSINSPMQCMMKEICAQCLQRHVDPVSGRESFVFSCYDQDQLLDRVDWAHLHERLMQNSVQEKQTNLWLDHLLAQRESNDDRSTGVRERRAAGAAGAEK